MGNKTEVIQDPKIIQAFQEYDRKVRIDTIKLFCWLIFTLMPAGFTLDYFVYPERVFEFLKMRLLCSAVTAVIWVLVQTPFGLKYYRVLGIILPLLPCFFISWMIQSTEGVSSTYYAGLNLVILAIGMVCPWTYLENLMEGLLIMAMYVVACLLHPLPIQNFGILFNNMYFLILTDIIVVASSFNQGKLRLREFALRFELDENRKMLEESNRKLVELDQMKSRFFANISHELRTPLTLLIAPLETLRSQKAHLFDEETREIMRTMQSNAMRLLKLINDLLDLVKLESGRVEIRKEPVAVEDFMKGLVQSVQGVAKDKKVQLSVKMEPGLGNLLLDRDKMEKVVLNLVFNAVKFTPAGGQVVLSVEVRDGSLILKVRDTGMGISAENLPLIFNRFWQADSSAQRKYQGTGIGLALVKELIEAQGGTVTAESQLDKGTTMTVQVPLEKAPEGAVPAAQPAEKAETSTKSDEWLNRLYRRAELFPAMTPLTATLRPDEYRNEGKPKILVADDEPDMLRFLRSELEKHFEVLEAVDGNQAVEKARQFLPELIVMDMMMPEKDGIKACRELKSLTSTQSIPIILLTARADNETKLSALNAGANDFLTKPFSTTELHVRVKNLVESHQFQRDLAHQKKALESTLEQLKDTEGQLVQNEKMASLGRLSAGIIHEINNPLNYATTALHLLKTKKERMPEGERTKYEEIVSDIEEGVGRVQRIVSDLRTFTHPKAGGGVDLVELEDVVSTALRFLSHELKNGIKVELDLSKDQKVLTDRNKLVHVFVNLIQNSVDAFKEKGSGEGAVLSIKSRPNNGKVLVHVWDNGAGIAPGDMDKVFDPFFTTKDVGQGMGLGLSICYRILNEQGGSMSVKSEKNKFTEFTLEIPAKR